MALLDPVRNAFNSILEWDAQSAVPDLANQVVIVTGGNAGIGYETCKALASKGAHVIIAARSTERGQGAVARIRESVPSATIEFMKCDVSSFRSIKAFVQAFLARNLPLHCLVNNAGIFLVDSFVTEDRLESTLATNYFGPHLLVSLLENKLAASAPSRVVWVASSSEQLGQVEAMEDFTGRNIHQPKLTRYGTSKLYTLMALKPWQQRLGPKGVDCFACHPGLSHSSIFSKRSNPKDVISLIFDFWERTIAQRQEDGAIPLVYCAAAPNLTGLSFVNTTRIKPVNPAVRNTQLCRKLFELTDQVVAECSQHADRAMVDKTGFKGSVENGNVLFVQ